MHIHFCNSSGPRVVRVEALFRFFLTTSRLTRTTATRWVAVTRTDLDTGAPGPMPKRPFPTSTTGFCWRSGTTKQLDLKNDLSVDGFARDCKLTSSSPSLFLLLNGTVGRPKLCTMESHGMVRISLKTAPDNS